MLEYLYVYEFPYIKTICINVYTLRGACVERRGGGGERIKRYFEYLFVYVYN